MLQKATVGFFDGPEVQLIVRVKVKKLCEDLKTPA